MPLISHSLPLISDLQALLLYTYRLGRNDGISYAVSRIAEGTPEIEGDSISLPPPLLTSAHYSLVLEHLESLLLSVHHRTPSSPLLCTHHNQEHARVGHTICPKCKDCGRLLTDQATANFPPPLDSQDQL